MAELSHVSEAGDVRMVDVGGKPASRRRAVARATVRMANEPREVTARARRPGAEGPAGREDMLTTCRAGG